MGLLISAVTRTQDQATSLIPLAMIPQLLFAGAIIPDDRMPAVARGLTDLVFTNAGYAGAGTSVHRGSVSPRTPNSRGSSPSALRSSR